MPRTKTRRAHGYSVYPRKDGRWGWAITVGTHPVTGNPQRVQGICRTESEAQAAAIEKLAKHRQGHEIQTGKDKTLSVYLDEWIDLYIRPHREPKTVKYYEGMIKHHIVPVLGRTGLRKLTAAQVQKMLNDAAQPFTVKKKIQDEDGNESEIQITKQLSTETVRGIRATLRSALSQAYREGLVAQNVATRVVTPKGERKERDYLRPEEINKLFEAAKGHPLERLILVTLLTGMRVGEATGLTWSNVDFATNTIKIQSQLQRVEGKLTLKRLKSDSSRRNLYMGPTAEEALKAQKGDQVLQSSAHMNKGDFNPMGLVFLNPEGRPFDPKYVDKHFKALLVSAGLRKMSFHKLRHTAATLSLASGVPLTTVKDQLGHSQISLTANTYGQAVSAALKTGAEILEGIVTKKPS